MMRLSIVAIPFSGEPLKEPPIHERRPHHFFRVIREFCTQYSGKDGKMAWIIFTDATGVEKNRFLKKFDGTLALDNGQYINFFRQKE